MNVLSWIDRPSTERGVRFAGQGDEWELRSYADLATDARRVASLLHGLGLPPGGVVSLVLSRPRDFIAAFMGSLLAGGTPSPIATPLTFRSREEYVAHMAAILAAARPGVVLTDDTLGAAADAAAAATGIGARTARLDWASAPEPDPRAERGLGERSVLQFTSGSSGRPKGVLVSRENLADNVGAIRRWLRWGTEDVFASWLPLYHDMGLVGAMITPVASGTDLWLMTPQEFVRAPHRWLECFGVHGATMTTAPSFGYSYAARRVQPETVAGMDFAGWRVAILGAERIDPAGVERFTALVGPAGFRPSSLLGAYGLAECTLAVSGVEPGAGTPVVRLAHREHAVGAPVEIDGRGTLGVDECRGGGWLTGCGRPIGGLGVDVVGSDGEVLGDGVFGELRVRGASVAVGYRGADGGDTSFDPAGLSTGDSGFVLDGQVYVIGRIGDSLKVRGRMVHAEDVEAALAEVPGVGAGRCAVVFGYDGGDTVAVVVESDTEEWLGGVASVVRAMTASTVRATIVCGPKGTIPRTSSGKPRRRVTGAALAGGELDVRVLLDGGAAAGAAAGTDVSGAARR